jgi:hypothetical protein
MAGSGFLALNRAVTGPLSAMSFQAVTLGASHDTAINVDWVR